jgi:hypothetical protein
MGTREVPDFLTVEEAARVLRIGRTAAYTQASRWLDTNGGDGLPVQRVGGLLRVPRAQFERHFGIAITVIPARHERRGIPAGRPSDRGSAQDIPRSEAKRRRSGGNGGPAQGGLPFAG